MIVVERVVGGAPADHHGRDLPEAGPPQLWWFTSSQPAIVLGSAQSFEVIDSDECDRLGLAVVKRRSGGGAVLVGDDREVWLDVLVPTSHPLWTPDVSTSADWLGEVWIAALGELGIVDLTKHSGPMVSNELSRLVCFAGRASGEVFAGRAKVVGISQRRTRSWARFQCALSLRWDVETFARVMRDPIVDASNLQGLGSDLTLTVDDVVDVVQRLVTERLEVR